MKYYIGVDLGGTNIAIGVVNEQFDIVGKTSVPTNCPRSAEEIADDIANTAKELLNKYSISLNDVSSIGIGTPGSVNSDNGVVERAYNLGFVDTPLKELISQRLDIKCFVENDANAAAYGEFLAGNAVGSKNAVCVTIGTGIGGGIIINGKIYSGSNFYGAELGHVVMIMNGEQCNCGRKGCMEKYCSANALIDQTKKAMLEDKDSLMWELCQNDIEKVDGRTSFDAMKKNDKTAAKVVNKYIEYLACGCTNFINIFQPDVLLIGGGVSKEGEFILKPLRELAIKEAFVMSPEKAPKILAAKLGNDAGIIGAALLENLHNS